MTHFFISKFAAISAALLVPAAAFSQDQPSERAPSDPISNFAMKDVFGNEQKHLIVPSPQLGSVEGERCLPDTRLCLSVSERDVQGQPLLRIRHNNEPGAAEAYSFTQLPLDLIANENTEVTMWDLAIRRAPVDDRDTGGETMFIGVISLDRQGYSGGAASEEILWLYRIDHAGTQYTQAQQILSVPLRSGRSIRACFNDSDNRKRHDACLDEMNLQADLILDPDNSDPMPRMIYHLAADTYPSDMPLRDEEDRPYPLTSADLEWKQDETCTYSRTAAWNPATARYEFDRPSPDCSIYGINR